MTFRAGVATGSFHIDINEIVEHHRCAWDALNLVVLIVSSLEEAPVAQGLPPDAALGGASSTVDTPESPPSLMK